uniref:Uncharacterized protein n=1 Tax=Lotus japonicus TaxID=34305 RepID=I3S6H9_LOTJA|nr:unknown [Lotus japonicus]
MVSPSSLVTNDSHSSPSLSSLFMGMNNGSAWRRNQRTKKEASRHEKARM